MEIHPGLLWAVTALVLLAGSSLEDKVTQRQEDASGVERGAVTLDCTYETGETYYYLYWYKQSPGGSLVLLLWQYSGGSTQSEAGPRFTADFQELQRSLPLSISDLQPSDSATYFCAFRRSLGGYRATSPLIFGKGTQLTVEPKSDPKEPSVLLMKSKASPGNQVKAACLAKDFYPKNVTFHFGVSHKVVYEQKDPILSVNGKYSAIKVVEVNENDEVECFVRHSDKNFNAMKSQSAGSEPITTPKSCDVSKATAEEQNPETVNMLSVTVLGLRVLFAKSIAFNTLMTIKLFVF